MNTVVILTFILILCLAHWYYTDQKINGGTVGEIPEYLKYHFEITQMPFLIPEQFESTFPIILPCYYNLRYQPTSSNTAPFIMSELGYFDGRTLHLPRFKYLCNNMIFNREINKAIPTPIAKMAIGYCRKCIQDYLTYQDTLLKVLGNYELYFKVIYKLYTMKLDLACSFKVLEIYKNLIHEEKLLNYPNIFTNNYQYLSRHILDCDYKKDLNLVFTNKEILPNLSDMLKKIKPVVPDKIDEYINTIKAAFTDHISLRCILNEIGPDIIHEVKNNSNIPEQIEAAELNLKNTIEVIAELNTELKKTGPNSSDRKTIIKRLRNNNTTKEGIKYNIKNLKIKESEDSLNFYINLGYLLSDGPYEVLINQCKITVFFAN